MMNRQQVLAGGVGTNEPELTVGDVLDIASAISHLWAPCTWRQFLDLAEGLIRAWQTPKRFERQVEIVVAQGWVANWQDVRIGNYDPDKVSRLLKKNVRRTLRGKWEGPWVLVWARWLELAQREGVAKGRYVLTQQEALAMTEAAMVSGKKVMTSQLPAVPPSQQQLASGLAWLRTHWNEFEQDEIAYDAITAPSWWFQTWGNGEAIDSGWAYQHPALVELAGVVTPGFRSAWPKIAAAVEEERRLAVLKKIADQRRIAEQWTHSSGPSPRLPTGTGLQSVNWSKINDPYGHIGIATDYAPGTHANDYSGKYWLVR